MRRTLYILALCLLGSVAYCSGADLIPSPKNDIDTLRGGIRLYENLGSRPQNYIDPNGLDPTASFCLIPGDVYMIQTSNMAFTQKGGTFTISFDTKDTINVVDSNHTAGNYYYFAGNYYNLLHSAITACGLQVKLTNCTIIQAPSAHLEVLTPEGELVGADLSNGAQNGVNYRVQVEVTVPPKTKMSLNGGYDLKIQFFSQTNNRVYKGCVITQEGYIDVCNIGEGGFDIRRLTNNIGEAIANDTIVVKNTLAGNVYTLYRGDTKIEEKQAATGSDSVIFIVANPQLGQYYVKVKDVFMKGCVIYSDYNFYHNDILHITNAISDNTIALSNKDGGVKEVEFTYDTGFIMDDFNTILDIINDGQMPYMVSTNVPVRLFVKNHIGNSFTLRIEYGPNISNKNSFTLPINASLIECKQPINGVLKRYPVTFRSAELNNSVDIIVMSSQYAIKYRLYSGNNCIEEKYGTGSELAFDGITALGKYNVKGLCYGQELVTGDVEINTLHPMSDIAGSNWVRTATYIEAQSISTSPTAIQDITYYDGLGSPVQTISQMASPNGKDVVQPIYYDYMRRPDTRTYLPFSTTATEGSIIESPYSFNRYNLNYGPTEAQYTFLTKEYLSDGLGRLVKSLNVGQAFSENDKVVSYSYSTNTIADSVYRIEHNIESNNIASTYAYAPNTLRRNEMIDEDGTHTVEFMDVNGHVILQRVIDDTGNNIDTYYVYDILGRLAWVISPEGSKLLNTQTSQLISYSYVYTYDGRNRVVEKKIPDKGVEYYVYDNGDKVVMSQDGNERIADRWKLITYDNLNRTLKQEEVTTNQTRSQLQAIYSAANTPQLSVQRLIAEYSYYKPSDVVQVDNSEYIPVATDMFVRIERNVIPRQFLSSINSVDPQGIYFNVTRLAITIRPEYTICQKSESGTYYYVPTTIRQALISNQNINTYLQYTTAFPLDESRQVSSIKPNDNERIYEPFSFITCVLRSGGGIPELVVVDPQGGYFNHPDFNTYLLYQTSDGTVTTSVYGVPETSYGNLFLSVFEATYSATMQAYINQYGSLPDVMPIMQSTTLNTPLGIDYLCGYMSGGNSGGNTEEAQTDYSLPFLEVADIVTINNVSTLNTGIKKYEKLAILSDGATNYVERAFYYDSRGRLLQLVERNHLGGISRYSTKYDFVGNVLASHEQHERYDGSQQLDTKLSTFTYDHRGRLLCETTSVNGGASATVSYGYDELGRLVSKTYGSGANAVTEELEYNIQGWLTSQNSPLFDMELKYYNPRTGIVPSYTGNITEWLWQQKDGTQLVNSYGFSYDKISRLLGYDHLVITYNNGMFAATQTNSFTEQNISYDRNGNIQYLKRYGDMPTLSESYQYLYDGNQLKRVNMLYMGQYISGAGAEYLYDANGNMTFDGQNHRQLEYNFLNLLLKVEGMNASATYKWLADGTKASVTDNSGYGFEYLGSFVYQRIPTDTSLESVAFGAGRFVANSIGSVIPNYYITDHLGSVRVVFTSPTNIVAQNDYYAFGLRHSNPNLANSSSNRHLFNGKEWQSTGSVGLLDYGARPYDPNTGRWINIDLLTEKYYSISPYVYCLNNPVRYIDIKGKEVQSPISLLRPIITMSRIAPASVPALPVPPIIFMPPSIRQANRISITNENIDWENIDLGNTQTWPRPPRDGEYQEGEPTRKKAKDRGERSLYDQDGGEWRPHKPDKYHPNGHWDFKPARKNANWNDVYYEFIPSNNATSQEKRELKKTEQDYRNRLEEYQRRLREYDDEMGKFLK